MSQASKLPHLRRYDALADRLIANSVPLDTGYRTECWHWVARVSGAYGRVSVRRPGREHPVPMLAHRAAWFAFKGVDPGAMTVDHACENTLCINPEHLSLCPVGENAQRQHWRRQARQAA
jgi:hypothetical protein